MLELQISAKASAQEREQVLQRWYRQQLRILIPPLLVKWEAALEVKVAECRVKKMKTKWGSCNPEARRIWLNLELSKKPLRCLEYLLVHELAHLIERRHNSAFISMMDKHLPQWRLHRAELNRAPLVHETWTY
jgi:predicted metal-dependent hydrolase